MKYYTWKLDWATQEGIGPTEKINTENVRIEPHFTIGEPSNPNSITYGYLLEGLINLDELSKWSVTEITVDEMLAAAKTLKDESYIENGFIIFPPMPALQAE